MVDELRNMLAKAENNQSPEVLLDELAGKYPFGGGRKLCGGIPDSENQRGKLERHYTDHRF